MFDIKENLKKLPDSAGVYMHKDNLGEIIYVGKAISLKNRVRQYFQSSKNMDSKVKAMVSHIDSFEYISCASEMEALILENNLIKKYKPKYNILLRDDKTYPFIKITAEKWPRIEKTRRVVEDGAKYFGPYTDVGAVNDTVELLSKVYKLKKCRMKFFPKEFKPCLNYYINQCNGMCVGKEDYLEYNKRLTEVENFLRGKSMNIIKFLEENMMKSSENLEYEKAAVYRDQINSAKALLEKQRVVLNKNIDMDLIIAGSNEDIFLFKVENGVLSSREIFYIDSEHSSKAERIEAFIKQYYSTQMEGVGEIVVDEKIADKDLIEEFLKGLWNIKVKIIENPKSEKKKLLELAKNDVFEMINISESHKKNQENRKKLIEDKLNYILSDAHIAGSMREVIDMSSGELIELFSDDFRVEAYDISNTNGIDNVGAMVVFDGLRKNKKAYRKFKLKAVEGKADDYMSMREVIFRRLKRALDGDKSFLPLPKIMLIDGGKGHIHAVQQIIDDMKLPIAVVGMIKDNHHKTDRLVYFSKDEIKGLKDDFSADETRKTKEYILKNNRGNNMFYSYIGNIQEEVHRFAIEYHKGLRAKTMLKSELDEIKGIGKKKREALMKSFGSIEKIKSATEKELFMVDGINASDARAIVNFYKDKR